MAVPKQIRMEDKNGRPIPNPIRYMCDVGHIHPSHRHAVACNVRNRKAIAEPPRAPMTPRRKSTRAGVHEHDLDDAGRCRSCGEYIR